MSLRTWEQQALASLEGDLASCEPALVARLALFTRLASGEDMPAGEKIQAGLRPWVRRSRPEPRPARRADRRIGLRRAVLLLWLMANIALIVIALACGRGGGQGACTGSWATTCAGVIPAPGSSTPQSSG
jgi:hypothetical protein